MHSAHPHIHNNEIRLCDYKKVEKGREKKNQRKLCHPYMFHVKQKFCFVEVSLLLDAGVCSSNKMH